jgi:hypothetical protein
MFDGFSWVAGLLEGEGYFGLRRNGSSAVIQISMTDGDVIARAKEVIGGGSIRVRQLKSGKPCHILTISAQGLVINTMTRLLPMLGHRRRARVEYCLMERAKHPLPKGDWTHCKRGHPLSGKNLTIIQEGKYQKRRCRECGKLRQRKHRGTLAA